MRKLAIAIVLLFGLSACTHGAVPYATPNDAMVSSGHRIAEVKCASCHAVGAAGESRNPNAPPFRAVSQSVAIMATEETLAEGVRIGHLDMPAVRLSRSEIAALTAYLRSLRP